MGCPFHPVKLIIPLVGSPFTGYVFNRRRGRTRTCDLSLRALWLMLYQLSYTADHVLYMLNDHYCKLLEATPARNPAALLGLHQSFVSSVKYPHSCGSFGFHSLPPLPRPYTTPYPLGRVTYLVGLAGFGNYLVAFGCTYGFRYRLFHSVGLSVSFAAVSIRYTYRLAPWLLYLLSDLNKCFCLLTGIARCTSLGVRGR